MMRFLTASPGEEAMSMAKEANVTSDILAVNFFINIVVVASI